KQSMDRLLEMAEYKKKGRCRVLAATGCLTQRYSRQLSEEMPEVDLFVGLGEFDRLSSFLQEKFIGERLHVSVRDQTPFMTARQILPDPDLPRVLATP